MPVTILLAGCSPDRALGLSCFTLIIGRFPRHSRELRFKNTIIPLPYLQTYFVETFKVALGATGSLTALPYVGQIVVGVSVGVAADRCTPPHCPRAFCVFIVVTRYTLL